MDYVEQLRTESRGAHSAFHQFALAISTGITSLFFFFEGEEDPAFYMPHLFTRLANRNYHVFVCYGRAEVLKTYSLVERDGRGTAQALFFIDKDHTDFLNGSNENLPATVYQTDLYSIENYLACENVFRRYWIERLHLSDMDQRYAATLNTLKGIVSSFESRCRVLMALVLIGRGLDGGNPVKLNLNNVKLEKIFAIDIERSQCRYKKDALRHFLVNTDLERHLPTHFGKSIKSIVRNHLHGRDPKTYIRGKYDLWIFAKILSIFTAHLSDRAVARKSNDQRATPTAQFNVATAVETLAPLAQCPKSLADFLDNVLS